MSKPKSIIDINVDEDTIDFTDIKQADDFVLHVPSGLATPTTPDVVSLDNITNCPRCAKPLVPAPAVNGSESTSFLECPNCGTLINTFRPTHYQAAFLRRSERYKLTAGGYGSGKSRANIEDVIKHLLLVPKARVCVTARTYPALEATFVKDFYSMFPKVLVKSKNEQKREMTLTNGSELIFRSFDDPTKLKSMNLTKAVIIEASDVPESSLDMLQSRIRNTAAMIPELHADGSPVMEWDEAKSAYQIKYRVDVRSINLETNPDSGWVKTFMLESHQVDFFGDAYNEGYNFERYDKDPAKYTQVVSTSANPYLPPNYEEEQTRNKSEAYIQQFYRGSFNFSTNLVFPNFGLTIVPPKQLPREYDEYGKRVLFYLIGLDYGVNDPTHVVFSAFSTETRKLYVYDELRLNNSDVKTIASEYRKAIKLNNTNLRGLLMMPRFDGRSYNKRESDLVTIGGMFEAEGLFFEPSFASHEARIIKTNALINHDQMEVFSTCEFLIQEMLNYRFKLDRHGNVTKKPIDKNDHGITALEFIIVELPHNLKELNLVTYIPAGVIHDHDRKQQEKEKRVAVFNPLEVPRDKHITNYRNNITVHAGSAPVHAFGVYDRSDEDDDALVEESSHFRAYVPGRSG